LKWSLRNY